MTLTTFWVILMRFTCFNFQHKHNNLVEPKQTVQRDREIEGQCPFWTKWGYLGLKGIKSIQVQCQSPNSPPDIKLSELCQILAWFPCLMSRLPPFVKVGNHGEDQTHAETELKLMHTQQARHSLGRRKHRTLSKVALIDKNYSASPIFWIRESQYTKVGA